MADRAGSLKRRRAGREPKRRFVLFCEGRNTEPAYFEALGRARSGAMIALEIVPGAGVPMTVAREAAEEAKSFKRRGRRNSFEKDDRVWAVFDRDDHPRFAEAVALCEGNGVGVARSDPCFELWLILHERDYDRPCKSCDVQKELGSLRPDYDEDGAKTPDCADVVGRVEHAEARAEAQLQRREEERRPGGNPSTTVFRLTREIRAADKSARR